MSDSKGIYAVGRALRFGIRCGGDTAGMFDAVMSVDQAQNRNSIRLPDGIRLNGFTGEYLKSLGDNPDAMEDGIQDIVIEMLETRHRC